MPHHSCSITHYLAMHHPKLEEILRSHCLSGILGPGGGLKTIKTFIIPSSTTLKKLYNDKTGINGNISEEQYTKYVNTILAHVLLEYVPKLEDFPKKRYKNTILRSLGFTRINATKIECEKGIFIGDVKDFIPAKRNGKDRQIAIYEVTAGEIDDTTGESHLSKGSDEYDDEINGGCPCVSGSGDDVIFSDMHKDIKMQVDSYFMNKNGNPYKKCVAGLITLFNNGKFSDNDKRILEMCLAGSSYMSIYYALLRFLPNNVLDEWRNVVNENNSSNKILDELNKLDKSAVKSHVNDISKMNISNITSYDQVKSKYVDYYSKNANLLPSSITIDDKLLLDVWIFYTMGTDLTDFTKDEFNRFDTVYITGLLNKRLILKQEYIKDFLQCPQSFLGIPLYPDFIKNNSKVISDSPDTKYVASTPSTINGSDEDSLSDYYTKKSEIQREINNY